VQDLTYTPQGIPVDYSATLAGELFTVRTIGTGGGCEALEVRVNRTGFRHLYALVTDGRCRVPERDDAEVVVGVYVDDPEDPTTGGTEPVVDDFDLSPYPEQAAAQVLNLFERAAERLQV
jgi:hypothetical protein